MTAELTDLKKVQRPQVIADISEARAHGDLSENAEYHAAKERQAYIEGRVNELGYKINQADIIETDLLSKEQVLFGARVVLENLDTGEAVEYRVVGPDESDIGKGRISISSPLGKALLGKKPGDEIKIVAPGGKREYELIEIY